VPSNYKHITSDEMNAQLKNVVEEFMWSYFHFRPPPKTSFTFRRISKML
jgi:hypothetical protein